VFSTNLLGGPIEHSAQPDGVITVGGSNRKEDDNQSLRVPPSKNEEKPRIQFEDAERKSAASSHKSKASSYKKMKNYLERKLEVMQSENSELKLMVQQILKN